MYKDNYYIWNMDFKHKQADLLFFSQSVSY